MHTYIGLLGKEARQAATANEERNRRHGRDDAVFVYFNVQTRVVDRNLLACLAHIVRTDILNPSLFAVACHIFTVFRILDFSQHNS